MLAWAFRVVLLVGFGTVAITASGLLDVDKSIGVEVAKPTASGNPDTQYAGASRELAIDVHASGHFLVEAHINGVAIPFLIDTGATKVTLSMADAEKVGIDTDWLTFDERYQTANGIIRAAPIRLDDIQLGEIQLREVDATVNTGNMPISLLGMSFLSRLDGYEVQGDRLLLRW